MLTPKAKGAIRDFFDAETNLERFDAWQEIRPRIKEAGLAKSHFYFWVYNSIQVDSEHGLYKFAGFEWKGCDRLVISSLWLTGRTFWKTPIDSAQIDIPDPSWLYKKLEL